MPVLCVLAIAFVGFLIRQHFSMGPSLWADEGSHIFVATAPNLFRMIDAYRTTATDQPFGMYPLLYCWAQVIGRAPAALRLFAVVFSSLGILSTAWAAKKIFRSDSAMIIASLLMGLSPFAIRYGYDITPYCLLNALVPFSAVCFHRCWKREQPGIDLPFVFVSVLLLNVHYFAYFLVAGEFVALLVRSITGRAGGYANFLYGGGVLLVGSLPILVLMDPEKVRMNHFWIAIADIPLWRIFLRQWGNTLPLQIAVIAAILGTLTVSVIRRKQTAFEVGAAGLLLVIAGLVILLAWLAQFLVGPILGNERYLMVSFPFFVLALAEIIATLSPRRLAKITLAGGMVALFSIGVFQSRPTSSIQDFDGATAWIKTRVHTEKKGLVLVPECCRWALWYYLDWRGVTLQPMAVPIERVEDAAQFSNLKEEIRNSGAPDFLVVLYYTSLSRKDELFVRFSREFPILGRKDFDGVTVFHFATVKNG